MKLRNKKTMITGYLIVSRGSDKYIVVDEEWNTKGTYNSLAELIKEWEDDYEDELFYVISANHKEGYECILKEEYPEICETAKKLGIGFETEEDCQKAVEKFKAWERLKDKEFRFDVWDTSHHNLGIIEFFLPNIVNDVDKYRKDLDLLFGGEE